MRPNSISWKDALKTFAKNLFVTELFSPAASIHRCHITPGNPASHSPKHHPKIPPQIFSGGASSLNAPTKSVEGSGGGGAGVDDEVSAEVAEMQSEYNKQRGNLERNIDALTTNLDHTLGVLSKDKGRLRDESSNLTGVMNQLR